MRILSLQQLMTSKIDVVRYLAIQSLRPIIYSMTAASVQAHTGTGVGLRVIFPRIDARTPRDPSRQGDMDVNLSILHEALGILDEFCAITNLAAGLEADDFNEAQLSALESFQSMRENNPSHVDTIELDFAVRSFIAPKVRRVSMHSPLIIELAGSVTTGALFLLKNPDKIGGWLPRVRQQWYRQQLEAERAKRAYEALTEIGIEVEDLDE